MIIPRLRPTLFNMFLVISWKGNVKVVQKWILFYQVVECVSMHGFPPTILIQFISDKFQIYDLIYN
jgi:hypothetical protein